MIEHARPRPAACQAFPQEHAHRSCKDARCANGRCSSGGLCRIPSMVRYTVDRTTPDQVGFKLGHHRQQVEQQPFDGVPHRADRHIGLGGQL
jgi:hypothetical protein